jgi:hypothetical protein
VEIAGLHRESKLGSRRVLEKRYRITRMQCMIRYDCRLSLNESPFVCLDDVRQTEAPLVLPMSLCGKRETLLSSQSGGCI